MAACAAVLSLIHTVKHIQNCASHRQQYYCCHIDCLGEMGCFFHDFLTSYSHGDIKKGRDLERQIRNVAQEAEDVIENCVADVIIHGSSYDIMSYTQLLVGVEQNMKSIWEKVLEIQGLNEVKDQLLPKLYSMSVASSSGDSAHPMMFSYSTSLASSSGHIAIDQEIQLMERLTNGRPSLEAIPIVGMGDIGNNMSIIKRGSKKKGEMGLERVEVRTLEKKRSIKTRAITLFMAVKLVRKVVVAALLGDPTQIMSNAFELFSN